MHCVIARWGIRPRKPQIKLLSYIVIFLILKFLIGGEFLSSHLLHPNLNIGKNTEENYIINSTGSCITA